MKIEQIGPWDYDALNLCLFCGDTNAMCEWDSCPHFVVAFQHGSWADDLCPPVSCNGFQFNRERLEEALRRSPDVVCKSKPGTRRHPAIDVYYVADLALAKDLRKRYRKMLVLMAPCHMDGNRTGLRGEHGDIVCAVCGDRGEIGSASALVM